MRDRIPCARMLAAMGMAAVLAGCSGDAINVLDSSRSAGLTVETAAVGGAARAPGPAFDPFSDSPATSVPMRQVIENPTLAEVMRPGPLPEFSIGETNAPVTILRIEISW